MCERERCVRDIVIEKKCESESVKRECVCLYEKEKEREREREIEKER